MLTMLPEVYTVSIGTFVRQIAQRAVDELQLPASSGTLNSAARGAVLRCIADIVERTVSNLLAEYNASVSVHSLPGELICKILACLSFKDLICATHVCHHWRALALDEAALWSCIDDGITPALALDPLLERTKAHPLTLSLRLGPEIPRSPWERPTDMTRRLAERTGALVSHMHRIQALNLDAQGMHDAFQDDISGQPSAPTGLQWAPLLYGLRNPAPLLESFSLMVRHPRGESFELLLPDDVFGGDARSLRKVSLTSVSLPSHDIGVFRKVTALKCFGIPLLSSQRIRLILSCCPELQVLKLQGARHAIDQAKPPDHDLLELELTEIDGLDDLRLTDIPGLLTFLRYETIKSVSIEGASSDSIRWTFPTLRRLAKLCIWTAGCSWAEVIAQCDVGGSIRFKFRQHAIPHITMSIADLAGLTSLTMHETLWPSEPGFQLMPCLEMLTIYLTTHDEHNQQRDRPFFYCPSNEMGIFQLSKSDPALPCPALQMLRITSRDSAAGAASADPQVQRISAFDVVHFVNEHLDFGARLLPKLVLAAVLLYEEDARAVLRTVVDELTVEDAWQLPPSGNWHDAYPSV